MKSSGSLRFFGKTVASDAAKYDRFCRVLQSAEQMQQEVYGEVRKLRAQIFEFRYNDIANTISQRRFRNWNYSDYDDIDSLTKAKLPLVSYDKRCLTSMSKWSVRVLSGHIMLATQIHY